MKVKTFEAATDEAVNTAIADWLEEMRKENPGSEVAVISTSAGIGVVAIGTLEHQRRWVWLSVVYDLIRHGGIIPAGTANRGPR